MEGAEDFDLVKEDSYTAVQVKHRADSISLGTKPALKALVDFWNLVCKNPRLNPQMHYLTTSQVANERDISFDGCNGIEAWRSARTNLEVAREIANYLKHKLGLESELGRFLEKAGPELVQEKLIKRFHWFAEQPNMDAVRQSVDDRITVLLSSQRRSTSLVSHVRSHIESAFWQKIVEGELNKRILTYAELLRRVEEATTITLPIPIEQIPELIGQSGSEFNFLDLLLQKVPSPPEPLLNRATLVKKLEELVNSRRVILLTGSIHKGKSTIAQMVINHMCTDAWWLCLTGRSVNQIDTLFLALAKRIENADVPELLIIDDLDISPGSHRVYKDSLALLMHRAGGVGRGVIITAQGNSSAAARLEEFRSIEILDIPELSDCEIMEFCIEHGCPANIVDLWCSLIMVWTRGHPKLVQVQLAELSNRGWPLPNQSDLTGQSSNLHSERQLARSIFSNTVTEPVAEFVYTISESSIPLERSIVINLGEAFNGLANTGDVVDGLLGKWLELQNASWIRVTPLLQGVSQDIWSINQKKLAHLRLHDAISLKKPLHPKEAAALLFHSYIGGDPVRMAHNAVRFQLVEDKEVEKEIQRELLWLPCVALEAGQQIIKEPFAATCLRSLQFRVASTIDDDALPKICARWIEEVDRIRNVEAKTVSQITMWLSLGITNNTKVPLRFRLDAAVNLATLMNEQREFFEKNEFQHFKNLKDNSGIPEDCEISQIIFLCTCPSIASKDNLEILYRWLRDVATGEIRREFDSMIEWHIVQSIGAFVHNAWAANHEDEINWGDWIALFETLKDFSHENGLINFGREVSKAKSIILCEYLDDSEGALKALDEAERLFGSSFVLQEQRTNVLFHTNDDRQVLEIWRQLVADKDNVAKLDPFSYRRVAICAARLGKWDKATEIFLAGAGSIKKGMFNQTKVGLIIDAAFCSFSDERIFVAIKLLWKAVLELPKNATHDDEGKWNVIQRFAVEVCTCIEKEIWHVEPYVRFITPGAASSPNIQDKGVEEGQEARSELCRAQILKLASENEVEIEDIEEETSKLQSSRYFFVRHQASMAKLSQLIISNTGTGFIEALVSLDRSMSGLSEIYSNGTVDILAPKDYFESNLQTHPEQWEFILYAGLCCSGHNLFAVLNTWLCESNQILGPESILSNVVQSIIEGANSDISLLYDLVLSEDQPSSLRCGAASRMLLEDLQPQLTLVIQAFLASAAIGNSSHSIQGMFNQHIARQFSIKWRDYISRPFLLNLPRTSVPMLINAIEKIENGKGTLRTLLNAAEFATAKSIDQFKLNIR